MKFFRTLLLLCLWITAAFAQSSVPGDRYWLGITDSTNSTHARPFQSVTSLPASCAVNDWAQLVNGNTYTLYYCSPANTWHSLNVSLSSNLVFNGTGSGVGPTVFTPATTDTFKIFDNTATTGSTLLHLQAGAGQGTNNIFQIDDASGTAKTFVSWASGYPYWFAYAPTNVTNFGLFSLGAIGDTVNRMKIGLDQGNPMIEMGSGTSALDVGIERASASTLQIVGGGLGFKGNLIAGNVQMDSCSGNGCTNKYQTVQVNSSSVTQRAKLNFVAGSNVTLTATDNGTDTTSLTIASTGGGGGGGGASLATQLLDFAPGTQTGSSIPFGGSCSASSPCYLTLGGARYSYTTPVTIAITSGSASDTLYYYIDGSGHRTFGYNSANVYGCTNCDATPASGITAFPSGSFPLYTVTVTAGAFPANAATDYRPILAATPLQNGGGTNITNSGGLTAVNINESPRAVTAGSDTIADSDRGNLVTYKNASGVSVTLPQAGLGNQFLKGWEADIYNYGSGNVTITPATSTIGGAATLVIGANSGYRIVSNGTNYDIAVGGGSSGGGGGGSWNGGTVTTPITVTAAQNALVTLTNTSPASQGIDYINSANTQTWFVGSNSLNQFSFYDVTNSTNRFAIDNDGHTLVNIDGATEDSEVSASNTGTEWYSAGASGNILLQLNDTTTGWTGNSALEFKTATGNTYFGVGGPAYSSAPDTLYTTLPTSGIAFKIPFSTGVTQFQHAISVPLRRVTANDTATNNDSVILIDGTSGARTETLPSSAVNGQKLYVKRVDSSNNTVTLAASAGKTIDGNTSMTLTSGASLTLIFESSTNTWWIF